MAKSVALARAEARIENMTSEISDLKDQIAAFALAIAATKNQLPAAQVVEQPTHHAQRDEWIPRLEVIEPLLKRPLIAVFDDREAAWEWANAHRTEYDHPVAVGYRGDALRAKPGYPVWVVY